MDLMVEEVVTDHRLRVPPYGGKGLAILSHITIPSWDPNLRIHAELSEARGHKMESEIYM